MKQIVHCIFVSIMLTSIICPVTSVWADSLWSTGPSCDNLYFVDENTKQRDINDIVFVIISEETAASVEAIRDYDTQSNYTGGFNDWFSVDGWEDILDLLKFESPTLKTKKHDTSNLPAWDLQLDNKWDGEAESTRKNSVQTKIAARIIEIRPNGNMLIEGKRIIHINDENSELLLSGIARPEDIDGYNQIQSSKIADLRVSVIGKGELSRASKPGVLATVLSFFQ
ncbi:MAG: flagellar basal body L-ring protein FlgH [Candidatus Omnitrophica bacterium]|nr:flagellar basal body L-ring protein FlgH [Candidatus Omnitrophota bacterium]